MMLPVLLPAWHTCAYTPIRTSCKRLMVSRSPEEQLICRTSSFILHGRECITDEDHKRSVTSEQWLSLPSWKAFFWQSISVMQGGLKTTPLHKWSDAFKPDFLAQKSPGATVSLLLYAWEPSCCFYRLAWRASSLFRYCRLRHKSINHCDKQSQTIGGNSLDAAIVASDAQHTCYCVTVRLSESTEVFFFFKQATFGELN